MEFEHDDAGEILAQLRELTDDYTPPEWACNTYRALLDALMTFELDLHQHIHKENNILFPRAIILEAKKGKS
jgi:regulator of cell morphogenesis and NO signaling